MWGVFKGKKNESSSAVVQDVTVSNTSNNHMPERNKVNSGKDMLTRAKSVDSMSPQSPLSNYRYISQLRSSLFMVYRSISCLACFLKFRIFSVRGVKLG